MCGITGWVDYKKDLRNESEILSAMAETLAKRGPDDTNVWTALHAGFGHKRLVVVDPLNGIQPMTKEKQGFHYTICYNGELYNTEDIRKELLIKGYSFQGHSDTEVLLTSYIEWGEDCLQYLNGIFAFAVWDEKRNSLFIGRDRLGVKPLFYMEISTGFIFGSELKALLAHPNVKAELDREGLAEVFALGPSHTPGSGIFKGIKELRPGHALKFTQDGLKVWRYWNVKSEEHTDSFEETVEKVRFLFKDAVTRQLVSDVPLSTFLSGGVDSSAITAIASMEYERTGKGQLHTYSIDYEGNDKFFKANEFQPNSDGVYIKKMTDTFGTIHHNCIITQETLAEFLHEAVTVRDVPGMADVDSSLLWFCREIKKDFVVSLSGECADEIFGGYPWFRREADLQRGGFPWMRSIQERQNLLKDSWSNKLQLEDYMMDKYNQTIAETPKLAGESKEDAKRRELFYLNQLWFMTTLLERKDRMSMGASLEVRVPFADHRLVEYVWNVPWEMKNYMGREKGLLRKALEGILPDEVLYRKKSPYPKTHNPIYTKTVTNMLKSALTDKSSVLYEFFDKERLTKIIETEGSAFKEPWFGQLMTGPQLLAHLVQIHHWFKDYQINIVE
ncbi:asparagine synthetase [Niallia circulans]|uniref:asparagine synthase (glutamine-hydrolyzing) n=1 Tax=Niallia circulans TaxID=1397 RepID=A0A0J1IIG7_NIACI|nr:asparagine synthase (glutamine-hydrolyzing) [Niallia circulans]KLV25692.1 asparagine synthase [Niallia circulans]MDR4316038.1 asparagine synthase (glutamine-hydrolyzing) [Niallia circulans]MED3837626.1 asparagine synthase (glutamine-hydrolyzing) [Niallia circulans]MED4244696.1 asparagine synthase (glutamine-hydrolyzing) [Niallia circulans]MED4249820.1 asparagine synthase (glutamine-hydrolyzing) [Niallia circulans]